MLNALDKDDWQIVCVFQIRLKCVHEPILPLFEEFMEICRDRRPVVVSLEADLFFAMRLNDVVEKQGGRSVIAENVSELNRAIDQHFPVLILLNLKTPGDWAGAVRQCKRLPQSRWIPIYAFGSHVDVETLKRAREAGVDHAWANSKMMTDLVSVVGRHIDPPTRYPTGWDEPLVDAQKVWILQGLEAFNRGEYYEQHEYFEAAWRAEERPIRELYQGILQIGVAFMQIQKGNWLGAVKMLRRGLPRLRGLPDRCQGIDIVTLRTAAEDIHYEIQQMNPETIAKFDQRQFPQIGYTLN